MSEARLSATTSRAEALSRLAEKLRGAGLGSPAREARLTLCAACGLSPTALIAAPDAPLGEAASRVADFASRRAAGEPLSKIVGRREFWGISLMISGDVLDPRPDTETLVETALMLLSDRRSEALCILDLGVGSGALLCALLSEFRQAHGVGVDVSPAATAIAARNVEDCGLAPRADIRIGHWTQDLEGPFDLIVANPPYVASAEIDGLAREVREFDPRLALDGGVDGLAPYREILPASARLLAPDGWVIVEIGAGQGPDVLAIAGDAGFLRLAAYRDLGGVERVIAGRAPAVAGDCTTARQDHANVAP